MKRIAILLLTCSLFVPGLLLAENAEEIPWNLNPDESMKEQDEEAAETDENSSKESEQGEDEDENTKEESDQDEEPEEEVNFDIKINKDYPDSYFYPGPNQRNDPSFALPRR